MVAPKSIIANIQVSSKPMNPNVENIKARPDNTALSCQERVEQEWSDLEWSGVTLEWKGVDNKSGEQPWP